MKTLILLTILFSSTTHAITILKVKNQQALIDLENTKLAVGDLYEAIDKNNNAVGLLEITKIQNNKALALIKEGTATSGMKLEEYIDDEILTGPEDETLPATASTEPKVKIYAGLGTATDYSSKSLSISYNKYLSDVSEITFSGFSIGADRSENISTDSNNNKTTLNTTSFDLAGDWALSNNWSNSTALSRSETKEVGYLTNGLSFGFTHSAEFGREDDDFQPTLNTTLSFGGSGIQQNVTSTVGPPQTFIYRLNQGILGLSLYWQTLETVGFSFSSYKYFYSTSKQELLAITQNRVQNRNSSDLVSTLSGLLSNSASIGIDYSLTDACYLSVSFDQSASYVDTSTTNYTSYGVNYTFANNITTAAYATQSVADGSRSWSYSFNLGYSF